jgi:hypothetical protein
MSIAILCPTTTSTTIEELESFIQATENIVAYLRSKREIDQLLVDYTFILKQHDLFYTLNNYESRFECDNGLDWILTPKLSKAVEDRMKLQELKNKDIDKFREILDDMIDERVSELKSIIANC